MSQIIGTCGNCGGPVEAASLSIYPIAHCKKCGASRQNNYGPVIPMNPPPKKLSPPDERNNRPIRF